jgi:two-component system sensor histidine kinase PilS (NtrC family)
MKTDKKNIFSLIVFRLIIVSTLLIAAVIIQVSTSYFLPLGPFYALILFMYVLSLFYLLLYLWNSHPGFQAYLQIFFDLLLITVLVYISGGLSGQMYFLYFFPIIAASLALSGRGAYLAASLAAILFGALADGLYYGLIPYFREDQYRELSLGLVLYTIFLAWTLFFVMAFLFSHYAHSLRKTREALAEAQRELDIKKRLAEAGQISALIAHEIRNPLAAISGSVQVLKNELSLDAEQFRLMEIVLKESVRVSQSIEQFLNLASPGKQTFATFNFSDVLRETLTMLRMSGALNGRYRIEGNFETSKIEYYGNSNQFKQVFWNLVRNALQAMPDGGMLTIDVNRENGQELNLRFVDTGKGMTPEERGHVFELFYSTFEGGLGLGMAVVRRIIDDYNGKIRISSEPQRGTEILITLPLRSLNNRRKK